MRYDSGIGDWLRPTVDVGRTVLNLLHDVLGVDAELLGVQVGADMAIDARDLG